MPIGLLIWIGRRHQRGRVEWLVDAAFVAITLAAVALAMPWMVVPGIARDLAGALAIVLAVRAGWRVRRSPWRAPIGRWPMATLIVRGAVTIGMAVVVAQALAGRRMPDGPRVDLACPFPAGTYLTASGGSRALVNAHFVTLAPDSRYVPWRGQSYGVDLVAIDRWGVRARGLLPADPSRYLIYGQPVIAPCSGRVVSAATDRPDMPVPERDPDRSKLAGNHVLIDCGGIEVLLAHLKPGTVRVAAGDQVAAGDPLGLVGNSGNTTEPHLHLSAQRRRPGAALLGGEPVWITIGGDFLVRNERLACGETGN